MSDSYQTGNGVSHICLSVSLRPYYVGFPYRGPKLTVLLDPGIRKSQVSTSGVALGLRLGFDSLRQSFLLAKILRPGESILSQNTMITQHM